MIIFLMNYEIFVSMLTQFYIEQEVQDGGGGWGEFVILTHGATCKIFGGRG